MPNDSPDFRVEAYLAGQLSGPERRRLEAELSTDPQLQQAVRRAKLIEHTLPEGARTRLRKLLDEVRTEVGPLTPPRLTVWDRIRAAFGPRWWLGLGTTGLLIAIGYFFVCPTCWTCPTPALIDAYTLEPALVHVQAGSSEGDLAYRASVYYGAEAHEELEKLKTESRGITPLYYLAHDYLRRDDYSRAESTFERLIAQGAELTAFAEYQDLDQLRFNRLLSRFGMHGDPAATLQALDTLLADPALAETETGRRARALAEALNDSWRWWVCRWGGGS